jgi:hypothetical protein
MFGWPIRQYVLRQISSSPTTQAICCRLRSWHRPGDGEIVFAADGRTAMTTIETQIPDSLYKQVKSLAERESISIDQLVSIALAGQVSAWLTKDYLAERAARGSWDKALKVLAQAPDVEPADHNTQ